MKSSVASICSDSTPRQIWLQNLLGYPTPKYLHIPVITHSNGDKLSKLTGCTRNIAGISREHACRRSYCAAAAAPFVSGATIHQGHLDVG